MTTDRRTSPVIYSQPNSDQFFVGHFEFDVLWYNSFKCNGSSFARFISSSKNTDRIELIPSFLRWKHHINFSEYLIFTDIGILDYSSIKEEEHK